MSSLQKKIYQLYYDKSQGILKVSPMASVFFNSYVDKALESQPQDYVLYYNHAHFFSFSRKNLIQKAREIREEWIREAEKTLDMYKNIKI